MDSSALVTLHSAGVSHSDLFRVRLKLGRMPESAEIRSPGFFHRFAFDTAKSATYASEISKGCGDRALDRLRRVGARVLVHGDTGYPEGIAALRRPPFLLYLRGELPRPKGAVSIVGSRKPTSYGEAVTRRFTRSFIQNGWSVVSGGAYGVDSIAHREALDSSGSTVAIVGTGIDVDYPTKHRALFDRIAETPECGIISCFPPETPPLAHNFPIRNALVAAYSAGTLVTEAAENS
jgi:DNA processing protein